MKVTTHEIIGTKELTILHFSDLHFSSRLNRSLLVDLWHFAQEKKPDYICISGDLIDHAAILEKSSYRGEIEQFLKHLGTIAPVLYGLGNHEVFYYQKKKKEYHYEAAWFQSLNDIPNVHFLDNTAYEDDRLFCYGLTLPAEYYQAKEVHPPKLPHHLFFPNDKMTVVLCHSPSSLSQTSMKEDYPWLFDAQLLLAGHMHHGMLLPWMDSFFPTTRGFIGPTKRPFPTYARGTIPTTHGWLIISGGMTKLSSTAPKLLQPLNRWYPSELEWIEVKKRGNVYDSKRDSSSS